MDPRYIPDVVPSTDALASNTIVQETGAVYASELYGQYSQMMTMPTSQQQIYVQPGMPHSILKARAIMTADDILAAGVANKWNFTGPLAANGKQPVFGLVNFEQTPQGVHITGHIDGLGQGTTHGFHIHEFGDTSSGCTTAGAHFNPFNCSHGDRIDLTRHLGDLGNVTADAYGVVHLNILDPIISLCGEHSIVGRAIVIHAAPDDLGRGGNEESLKTGNSGARLACGVIGFTKPQTT